MHSKFEEDLFIKKKLVKAAGILFILLGIAGIAFGLMGDRGETAQTSGVLSEKTLIPGGQSVGINMSVRGVLVMGLEEIETEDSIVSPGLDCGIEIGDIIVSIDGTTVYYARDVLKLTESSGGKPMELRVLRKYQTLVFTVSPVMDISTGTWKLGIWVKEKIAGIGTLTFYDPDTKTFAALGHGIYETQTGTLLGVGDGTLMKTEVKSVEEGEAGKPGQIRGIFYADDEPMGILKKNTIFGMYSKSLNTSALDGVQPMVVARRDQVQTGPAKILTTIEGNRVEAFDIEIVKVNEQDEPEQKSFEIIVTDKRLLARSGGIVQGMSGSPVIQNNRIVGAITHVFVDNPKMGYGIYVEWMLKECQ